MCVLARAAFIAGCGESPNPPSENVQNYLNAVGAGNYINACGYVDGGARETLVRSEPIRTTCEGIFEKCLPHTTLVLKQDQTQLLYANIQVSTAGSTATADVSGTLVASELKHVTLRNEAGVWKLTSFGYAIEKCRLTPKHARRKSKRSRPH